MDTLSLTKNLHPGADCLRAGEERIRRGGASELGPARGRSGSGEAGWGRAPGRPPYIPGDARTSGASSLFSSPHPPHPPRSLSPARRELRRGSPLLPLPSPSLPPPVGPARGGADPARRGLRGRPSAGEERIRRGGAGPSSRSPSLHPRGCADVGRARRRRRAEQGRGEPPCLRFPRASAPRRWALRRSQQHRGPRSRRRSRHGGAEACGGFVGSRSRCG
jgi:hypothetical protein